MSSTSDTVSSRDAWRVALAGLLALASAMGIGRFAFTPLLPMMLHDGVVTLEQGGWLATANYLGYLAGALLCMVLRAPAALMVRLGLLATALLTLAMAFGDSIPFWIALRALAGVVSAAVFVFSSAWCMIRLERAPHLVAIIFCGPGLGIALTGFPAGAMVAADWSAAQGWLAFGALAALLMAVVWPVFQPDGTQVAPTAAARPAAPDTAHSARERRLQREAWYLTFAYGLAGFGYIITATFLPVIARRTLADSIWPDLFWPMLGVAVALGALLATRVPTDKDQRVWLAGCYAMQAVGVLLTVLVPNIAGFALGSILVGLPFTTITLFVVREVRRLTAHRGEGVVRRMVGQATASFSIGQVAGPPLAVRLAGVSAGQDPFALPLMVAAAALLSGMVMFLHMRHLDLRHAR